MNRERKFDTEADLVAAFVKEVERLNGLTHIPDRSIWTVYQEACGWDLLLVDQNGVQIGIEAKLTVNAKVLCQSLPGLHWNEKGPDYRAVLVPRSGLQLDLKLIAAHLGLTVISMGGYYNGSRFVAQTSPHLPEENGTSLSYNMAKWHAWLPSEREALPDYIPDVKGGKAAPVQLTQWKIRAIKLMILLERNGFVTRKDMAHVQISPTRWTAYNGFLKADAEKGRYVRCDRTPDLKAQHPVNWPEIEADFEKWALKT